eukprot:g2065.t1
MQSLMLEDADWTKMVEMQLAKVRAINALDGPRMRIVWSGTCHHLGKIPRYPTDWKHILDAETVLVEFLKQADGKGKVTCKNNLTGELERRIFCLTMFSHRWERPHPDPRRSYPDSADNKKARALAYYGSSGLCPVFQKHRYDYYYWIDYAGVNQDNYHEKLLGIAKLPGYISCAIEVAYFNSSTVDYEKRAWTRLERVLGFAYSWSPLFVYMDDHYPQQPCNLSALSNENPELYSIDAETGSLRMKIMDPCGDDAECTDPRDRAYIGKLLEIIQNTRTLNPEFKNCNGGLVLGKSTMPVDTLHGKMDAEVRAKSATAMGDKMLAESMVRRDGGNSIGINNGKDVGSSDTEGPFCDRVHIAHLGNSAAAAASSLSSSSLSQLRQPLITDAEFGGATGDDVSTTIRRVRVAESDAKKLLAETTTDDYLSLLRLSPRTPAEQRAFQQGTGWLAIFTTWVNVTKCFVGAASFELPHAFSQAGVAGAVGGVCILAILSSFSLRRLAYCCELMPRHRASKRGSPFSYYIVGDEACGTFGCMAAWFGVVAMSLGVCGSYIVFVCTTLADVTGWKKSFWLLLTIAVIIPLSWVRRLRIVAITSFFGIIALVCAVVAVTADASSQDAPRSLGDLKMFDLEHYPLFLGNAGFLYLISTAVLPLYQDMDAKSAKHFRMTFDSSVIFVTLINLAFGLYAWLQYGSCASATDTDGDHCIAGNVISNLTHGPVKTAVQLLLSVDLVFTSIVFLYPFNEAIERALLAEPPTVATAATTATARDTVLIAGDSVAAYCDFPAFANAYEWKRNALRTASVCAVGFVAYLVPSFSLLTGLTGSFGNNILGFILPPLFYWRLRAKHGYWDTPTIWKYCEQAFLLVVFLFGIGFLFLGTFSFVSAIAKHKTGD